MLDAVGNEFTFDLPPRRVVSLVPSLTESLFALGAGGSVVGITDFCIFPEGLSLPRLGGTKNPSIEAIRALEPDLVHLNLEENLQRHATQLQSFVRVFVSEPKTVRGTVQHLMDLGAIHHCSSAAEQAAAGIKNELARTAEQSFTFACAIWKNPWMWCGGDTYVSDLISSIGGRNVLADERRYPTVTLEAIRERSPHLVFLPDEPYVFNTTDTEHVSRTCNAKVIGPFQGHLATWHGTRTLLGLRFLRDAVRKAL